MFSFLAQMSLSEYLRRRRITASIEAIKTGKKIIDTITFYFILVLNENNYLKQIVMYIMFAYFGIV